MADNKNSVAKATKNSVNKQAFVNRKLSVLNQKMGSQYERNATRVIENNR